MLTAIQNDKKIIAWQAQKELGSFVCPECNTEVIFKRGKIKSPHFAHLANANCQWSGESEIHLRIKRELYEALSKESDCFRCELERQLNGVRPDVSLYIGRFPVAIEIQRSNIRIETIIQRTMRYAELGIYLLWILPELKQDEEQACKVRDWHKYLYRLFYSKLYIWQSGATVMPIKLEPYYYYINEYEDWETGQTYGGYSKPAQTKRIVIEEQPINIAKDFRAISRPAFTELERYTPDCKIWLDNIERDWSEAYA